MHGRAFTPDAENTPHTEPQSLLRAAMTNALNGLRPVSLLESGARTVDRHNLAGKPIGCGVDRAGLILCYDRTEYRRCAALRPGRPLWESNAQSHAGAICAGSGRVWIVSSWGKGCLCSKILRKEFA